MSKRYPRLSTGTGSPPDAQPVFLADVTPPAALRLAHILLKLCCIISLGDEFLESN